MLRDFRASARCMYTFMAHGGVMSPADIIDM